MTGESVMLPKPTLTARRVVFGSIGLQLWRISRSRRSMALHRALTWALVVGIRIARICAPHKYNVSVRIV